MKRRPVESHILPGMEAAALVAREEAAVSLGNSLTARLLEPLGNIDFQAGEMERNGPLFVGTGSNPTLF
jgi:hypothetical protein